MKRLLRLCPITAISQELVKFDLQRMENPELAGTEYQQGTLFGYEVREYLLEKWGRACSYCQKKDIPLQVEHIQARANGGTDRMSNLCLACEPCNTRKGTQDIAVFLAKKPDLLGKILVQAKKPLKDAAAVNAQAQALVDEVLANPDSTFMTRPHPRPEWGGTVTDVYRPDGVGVRFDAHGQFVGFITR